MKTFQDYMKETMDDYWSVPRKSKLPRKKKKAFIKAHGRVAYQAWRISSSVTLMGLIPLGILVLKLIKDKQQAA